MSVTDVDRRASHIAVAVSMALTGLLAAGAVATVSHDRMAPWIIGRATGICAYLLLTAVVGLGLWMTHPVRRRRGGTGPGAVRLHITLFVLAAVSLAGHILVLATDRWAGVGWLGALLPWSAHYRPTAVAAGVVAAWMLVLVGGTAALAGRIPGRAWRSLHRLAAPAFALMWLHGLFAGSDAAVLRPLYAGTAAPLVLLLVTRRLLGSRA